MRHPTTTRICLALTLSFGLSGVPALVAAPQPGAGRANHPQSRAGVRNQTPRGTPQDHLQQWYERHKELTVPDQQRALEQERGFRDLPQQTQQRYRDQLAQLNNMSPQQRNRMLERTEILERMSGPERQQYRAAAQNLAAMPPDRKRLVARAILDIRNLPPNQRQGILNSERFRAQFSDSERATLSNLLAAEPYSTMPPR